MVIPVLISFAVSVILGPIVIPFLRRLKMGQTERVDGVQSHLKKAGTPTMGGVIFLISAVITALFYIKDYPKIIPVLFLTLGFGIIGFLDDYITGDAYFKVNYPGHNLVRTRCQLALAKDIMSKYDVLSSTVVEVMKG